MVCKRILLPVIGLILVALLSVACGGAIKTPTPTKASFPTKGVEPTAETPPTLTPSKTPAPTPTLTIAPSPTPRIETLPPTAHDLCEAAQRGPEKGILPGRLLILENHAWDEEDQWARYDYLSPPQLLARSLSELAALVCIEESRVQVGSYTDGEAAYKKHWDVRIVGWPDGQAIASVDFSSEPPGVKTGSGSASGAFPVSDLWDWLESLELLVPLPTLAPDQRTVFTVQTAGARRLTFSPDGKLLATGSDDMTVKTWKVETGEEVATMTGHADGVTSVAFSPDGKLLASGSFDKTVKV